MMTRKLGFWAEWAGRFRRSVKRRSNLMWVVLALEGGDGKRERIFFFLILKVLGESRAGF